VRTTIDPKYGRVGGCSVMITDTKMASIGGSLGPPTYAVATQPSICNILTGVCEEHSALVLPEKRSGLPKCGVITNEFGRVDYVTITGGGSGGEEIIGMDLWDLRGGLPGTITRDTNTLATTFKSSSGASGVTSGGSFVPFPPYSTLFFGGTISVPGANPAETKDFVRDFYLYTIGTGWIESIDATLIGRQDFVTIQVPSSTHNCPT
jgi:hypothetical protein